MSPSRSAGRSGANVSVTGPLFVSRGSAHGTVGPWNASPAGSRRSCPASRHPPAERYTTVDGFDVFYRESPRPVPGQRVMMHVHGFGLSGRYLLPTAQALSDEFHTLVPDLPGFGRSAKAGALLDVPDLAHAAARFLDSKGIERATLVGNSMGCPVICEFAYRYPERIERAVLVSPAGGIYNQPLRRAVGAAVEGRPPRAAARW